MIHGMLQESFLRRSLTIVAFWMLLVLLSPAFAFAEATDGEAGIYGMSSPGDKTSAAIDSTLASRDALSYETIQKVQNSSLQASDLDEGDAPEPAYAILYEDGEMVFQRGSSPDAAKGEVVRKWTGFETESYDYSYIPWRYYRESIKRVQVVDTIVPVTMRYWFYGCSNLEEANLSAIDTSAVTSMYEMFDGCSSLTTLDVASWDTSAVTDMGYMFDGCSSLSSVKFGPKYSFNLKRSYSYLPTPKSGLWKQEGTSLYFTSQEIASLYNGTGNAQVATFIAVNRPADPYAILYSNGDLVFQYGDSPEPSRGSVIDSWTGFEQSDSYNGPSWSLQRARIQKVVFKDEVAPYSMRSWFSNCGNLTSLEGIEKLNTSRVTSMSSLFNSCSKLTRLDLSSFDTHKVTSMDNMFESCTALESLKLTGFDTSRVTSMASMFEGCRRLKTFEIGGFDTSRVTSMGSMFEDCVSAVTLPVSNFSTANVTTMYHMFDNCAMLTTLDVSKFDTGNVTDMEDMFYGCPSLKALDVSHFDTVNVIDMRGMFSGCKSLSILNVSGFNTSMVHDMYGMFSGCSNLLALDVSKFDTSRVGATISSSSSGSFDSMFSGCSKLKALNLKSFQTYNATSLGSMFRECSSLESLDLSSFDTTQVTSISSMFYRCKSLKSLDLSSFDTSKLSGKDRGSLSSCTNLQNVKLGAKFTFAMSDYSYCLNDPSFKPPYTGKWVNAKGGSAYYATELAKRYDGSTMAGTYVWETTTKKASLNPVTINGHSYDSVDFYARDEWGYSDGNTFKYDMPYTGKAVTQNPTVYYEVRTYDENNDYYRSHYAPMTRGVDYELVFENNLYPGKATMIVVGKGLFTGEAPVNFTIYDDPTGKTAISSATISDIPDQVYTGKELTPAVKVAYNGNTLAEGKDYAITRWVNNTLVGSATVTVTGIGGYTGTATASFNIVGPTKTDSETKIKAQGAVFVDRAVNGNKVDLDVDQLSKSDSAHNSDLKKTYASSDSALFKAVDVKLNVVDAKTGKVKESLTRNFGTIVISIPVGKQYDGLEATVTQVHTSNGKTVKDSETKTTVENGQVSVSVTHLSEIVVNVKKPTGVNISTTSVSVPAQVYTSKALRPAVTVKVGNYTLKAGTDYTVTYSNNVKAGTATAKITGKGSYKGTKTVKFKIAKAANTIEVSKTTEKLKASILKKQKKTVEPLSVAKAKGKVTYARVAKGSSKNLTINKKSGKITVKKGTKKGAYAIKVKVKAAGNGNFSAKTVTLKATVKVV